VTLAAEIGECTVAEVMGTEFFTLSTDTAVGSARRLLSENGVSHMLVLDHGTLAGIVCGEDLRHADRDACVGDFMISPVLCITPDTTLQEAVDIMGANDIDCLPVVIGARLLGMVTRAALATAELSPSDNFDFDEDDGTVDDDTDGALLDVPCEVCTSTDDVHDDDDGRAGLALCAGCRKRLAQNQRC